MSRKKNINFEEYEKEKKQNKYYGLQTKES